MPTARAANSWQDPYGIITSLMAIAISVTPTIRKHGASKVETRNPHQPFGNGCCRTLPSEKQ